MSEDKVRAEFEAWAGSKKFGLSKGHLKKDEDGEYLNFPTQCYWDVWRASRAELVIDLPETNLTGTIGVAHKSIARKFREAIEYAGVRVKP